MRIVPVPVGSSRYDIKVGGGLLSRLGAEGAALKLAQRWGFSTDSNTGKICPGHAQITCRVGV